MPKRIQMTRQRPWRWENPDAVIVDRSTQYGNRFVVVKRKGGWCVADPWQRFGHFWSKQEASAHAVERFRREVAPTLDLGPLRGRDLACWCSLADPCHADVLLELANPKEPVR